MAKKKSTTSGRSRSSARRTKKPTSRLARWRDALAAFPRDLAASFRRRRIAWIAGGVLGLVLVGAVAGWVVTAALERAESEHRAARVLSDMKAKERQAAASREQQPEPKYASIDEIPGLPRYTEADPARPFATVEEPPRAAAPLRPAPAGAPVPEWRKRAIPFRDDGRKPLISVVIDDMGLDRPRSRKAAELPAPLTLSYLPYGPELKEQMRAARARGHELMLHLPMEPLGSGVDPGPNPLLVRLSPEEVRERTVAALGRVEGVVGLNNHMGSRFTADRRGMLPVIEEVRARGLLFLDSRTSRNSVADSVAAEMGVAHAQRHVFLDDEMTADSVRRQLAETERVARAQGFAIAIGHPHDVTVSALADWLPTLAAKGFAVAPVSAVVKRRMGLLE